MTPPWMRHSHHPFDEPPCGPPRRGGRVWWYFKARLHRRLFLSFALAILVTVLVVGAVTSALRQGPSWRQEVTRVQTFAAGRFASVWRFPAQRDELAMAMARDLDVDVTLLDAASDPIATFTPDGPRSSPACDRPAVKLSVRDGALDLGTVRVCTLRHSDARGARQTFGALAAVVVVLWGLAGMASRRFTRPLNDLVRVVQDIGQGRLASRMKLGRHDAGELGAIALAVNDMASRIERQIEDQRNLLAAVSHEIRSPLARMRFMVETLRDDDPVKSRALDDIDREMEGIDALVGDLLATSRMDFDALRKVPLDAAEMAVRALERAGLDATLCAVNEGATLAFEGDATLVQTALANLLGNARKHGGTVRSLRVSASTGAVRFAVEDDGDGFSEEELSRAFEPFYRGDGARRSGRAGVGLGLALVQRIAEVHGGRAWAENLPGRGARVGIELSA